MSAKTKTEKTPVALKMPSTKETGVCKVFIISFLLLLIQNFTLSTTYIHCHYVLSFNNILLTTTDSSHGSQRET